MMEEKKLILIDGNSLVYRAFYALPLLQNSRGRYTNAIYGFLSMLFRLLEEEKPAYLAAAFDLAAPTFRHKIYAAYKATRSKTPDELGEQIPVVKEILQLMGIKVLEAEGYEADDIIGTLSQNASEAGLKVLIVTGDADALQLVNGRVEVALTKKGISNLDIYNLANFKDKLGLTPEQVTDYKALKGDPSDNIPGVPGIGEKTAVKLLKEYDSLESVLKHVAAIPGQKLKESLSVNRQQALLSKDLATICRNVPFNFSLEQLSKKEENSEKIYELFSELEFKRFLAKVGKTSAKLEENGGADRYQPESSLLQEDDYPLLAAETAKTGQLYFAVGSVDCITPGNLAVSAGTANYLIPTAAAEKFITAFAAIFSNPDIVKISAQGKSLYKLLAARGIPLKGLGFETSIAAYLFDPIRKDYSLPVLAKDYLSLETTAEPLNPARDLGILKKLFPVFKKEIEKLHMEVLFYGLELPLVSVLAKMETRGIAVEAAILSELAADLMIKEEMLKNEIFALAGEEFNINSPKQLRVILFEKLNLPVLKRTKTGPSTDASVLEELANRHEIVAKILQHRYYFKLRTTYLEGLLKLRNPETGRIYTTYNQTITATGRLSSTEPNLQNIPVRQGEGSLIRKAFIPGIEDAVLLAADYSQIELRLLAHLSGDESLCRAFWEGQDIHKRTAAEVCRIPIEAVNDQLRSKAKAINFGIVYGMSDYGLSQSLNISRQEAAEFIEGYFARYPGVKAYIHNTINESRKRGYVTTLFNRRRYLPDINHKNYNLRSFAERTAMNTPIQGTAADIIKKAMVDIDEELKKGGYAAGMLLQVHDELVFEVPLAELEVTAAMVKRKMENVVSLCVPLTVDLKFGFNWLDMTALDVEA